jgi:RNA polymerase sigma-70 factor, ECF subfamily
MAIGRRMLASGMIEAEVIEGAKQGDGQCFEVLYASHKKRVYSLCLRMVGNKEEAEDLTQEAFLQLYRKIESFRGDSKFSTWLHRLTVNVVLMQLRKNALIEVSLEEVLEPTEEEGAKKDFGSEDRNLAGYIDRVILGRAIESLPPGYRRVFMLHDVEGYEHSEIAEMLGSSMGNSKSQLHKARMRLREVLNVTRAENSRRPVPRKMKTQREVSEVTERSSKAAASAA